MCCTQHDTSVYNQLPSWIEQLQTELVSVHKQLICLKIIPNSCNFTKGLSCYNHILCSKVLYNPHIFNIIHIPDIFNICHNIIFLFTSCIKTDLPNVSKSQLTSTHLTNSIVDLILLPSAIIMFTFMNFLTNFSILRAGI